MVQTDLESSTYIPSGEAREAADSDHHLATRLYRRGRIVVALRGIIIRV